MLNVTSYNNILFVILLCLKPDVKKARGVFYYETTRLVTNKIHKL